MSPRDDEVWRQVVDDARVRAHEVRACEGGPHAGIGKDAVDRIATRATHPGAIPSARSQTIRFAALAFVVISLASTAAWVTAPIFWAGPATPQRYTFLEAMPAVASAEEEADRIACAQWVNDGCIEVWKGLRVLAESADAAVAERAREQLALLARAIDGSFPRVVSFDVVDANEAIHAAQQASNAAECLGHMDAACKAALAGVFCVTRHAIDPNCNRAKRVKPIDRLRGLAK